MLFYFTLASGVRVIHFESCVIFVHKKPIYKMYAIAFIWILGVSAALGQTAESKFLFS